MDYPKTYIYNKGDQTRDFGFMYPVIVKASDSISFFQNPFEGMNKAYVAHSEEEFNQIISDVYSHGYEKSMIIQDFIPGEDDHMRVLTCYSDQNAKVKMMCLGHVLLEEHTPKGIGNHAAIITEYEEEYRPKPEPELTVEVTTPTTEGTQADPVKPVTPSVQPKPKKRKNVSISNVTGARTYSIENEQDIDEFLAEMKQKLLKELEENTVITLS